MTDWVLGAVRSFGYPILAVGLFVDGLGLPFPGQIALLCAGFLVSRGELHLPGTLLAGTSGLLAGTLTAFGIGRGQGERLARWLRRLGVSRESLRRAEASLNRWGAWGFVVGHFIPTLGNVTPYLAGAGGVGWARFLAAALLHGAVWVGLPVAGGYYVGSRWQSVAAWLGRGAEWVAALACLGLLILWSVRALKSRRQAA